MDIYPKLIITQNLADTMRKLLDQGAAWMELEELHDLPSYRGDRLVVVGDICRNSKFVPTLLKVLESATCRVVCVATRDEFDATFLSRFATVSKEGYVIPNTSGSGLKVEEFLCDDDRDLSQLVRSGPAFLPLAMSYFKSRLPSKKKVIAA